MLENALVPSPPASSADAPLAPSHVTAAALERLETWQRAAHRAYSPETVRAWRDDWRVFTGFCQSSRLEPLPARPGTVAAFLEAERAAGRSLATLKRRAATVTRAHKSAGLTDPCRSEEVRLVLRAMAREVGTQQKQAPGLNQRDADRIAHVLEASTKPKDVRDLAVMLVGRDLLARASELISVQIENIAWDEEDETAQVTLRRSKTSTEALPFQLGPDSTAALKRWIQISGISAGPVFVGLTRGGKLTGQPLTRRDVGRIIKARAGQSFSAHSLRVGMAQDLVSENVETVAVLNAGGWKSEGMLVRYTRKQRAKTGAISRYYARRHK